MKTFGTYYSHTLLSTILSHSIRWCRANGQISAALALYEDGQLFLNNARTLLHGDLQDGRCDIPTIQTLLLLSAQEFGQGNCTQAWMYSGVAFRLAEDLGITVDARRFALTLSLSEEDIEIRNRLFWSCFIWDKMISLYMGRRPLMYRSDVSPAQAMGTLCCCLCAGDVADMTMVADDSTEYEIWSPHGLRAEIEAAYPTTQSHAATTFIWTCKLTEIIHELLVNVYNPLRHGSDEQVTACLTSQAEQLHQLSQALPRYLRINTDALPAYCPPNHIVTLKYCTSMLSRGVTLTGK